MFGLSFAEVLIIAVLALILLGPEQLPTAARSMGKVLRELKRATDGLKDQIEDEVRGLDLEGKDPPKLESAPYVPAMPVPGKAEVPPEATPENVPGLEAALAEPAAVTPAAAEDGPAAEAPAAPAAATTHPEGTRTT